MSLEIEASSVIPAIPVVPKEMLSWSTLEDGRTHYRINFSSLSIIQECLRKAEFSLVRKLRSNLESPATLFGSAIHKGLEVFYSGKRTERTLPSDYSGLMQMISCGQWQPDWEENLLLRAARAFVLKAEPLLALPDDNKQSVTTGVWMLRHYMERYLTDEYVVLEDASGPLIERKVTMRAFEDARFVVDFFGTIDAVLRNEITGVIVGCDHKTASSLYNFYDSIRPNFQYVGYNWAINKALGIESDTFLVNVLQKKAPPKTNRGSPPDFARQLTTITEEDHSEFLFALTGALGAFGHFQKLGHFPQTTGACTNKYGACSFLEICSAPRELRENIISARYSGGQPCPSV